MAKKLSLTFGGAASPLKRTLGFGGAAPGTGKKISLVVTGGVVSNDGRFGFTISTASTTSAGVYNSNDVLVRTLWSNVAYTPGSYSAIWDGRLDDLSTAPDGNYIVRVLSSQVSYSWEGVLGNTSFVQSGGDSIHRGYQFMRDMVEVGSYMYFVNHYVEGPSGISKFLKTTPQTKVNLPTGYDSGTTLEHICSDGTLIYASYYDTIGSKKSWVAAVKASDDTRASFSSGTTVKADHANNSVSGINVLSDATNYITGLAVQRTGNYLFISYGEKNLLQVVNKTTGALVTSSTITGIKRIATDPSGNLLVISGTSVTRYPVNTDGSLGTSTLTISGLAAPLYVTSSSSLIYVVDGGSSQQVKAFDSTSGSSSWVLGTAGGYSTSATVTNTKFYFSDVSGGVNEGYVALQSDGSFWVNDRGNYRALKFDSSRVYQTQIAYISSSYTSAVDANNSTRIFDQYLEYSVDYSKPLATAWTLVANWRNQVPADFFGLVNPRQNVDMFGVFSSIATLSNNRTYGFIKRYADNAFFLVELVSGGSLRVINTVYNAPLYLGADGALYRTIVQKDTNPKTSTWTKQALTGFDGSNNPTWGTATTIAATLLGDQDPVDWSAYPSDRAGVQTDSGLLLQFRGELNQGGKGFGSHLNSIPVGSTNASTSNWKWKTAYATSAPIYQGAYPTDGAYDIGNHANFAVGNQIGYGGGAVTTKGKHIFWNYYGEFWKDAQTNYWHHVYDNGLNVGYFGTDSILSGKQIGFPGMAGGVHFGSFVIDPGDTNTGYIYHAEEGGFSGVHRWKITGLNTVSVQDALSLPVSSTLSFYQPVTPYVDLLAGLPYQAAITTTTAGWSRTSTEDTTAEFGGNVRSMRTGIMTYDRFSSPGLFFKFSKNNETEYYSRTLPTTSSQNWELLGTYSFYLGSGNDGDIENTGTGGCYIELLDTAGKSIIRYYHRYISTTSPNQARIYGNSTVLASTESFTPAASVLTGKQPVSIKLTAGVLSITFQGTTTNLSAFDSTAVLTTPASFRVTMWDKSLKRDRALTIYSLTFRNS